MEQQKRRRGRPKGSGYDDTKRIDQALDLMRAQGVSRRKALLQVDSDPATVRRLERKMTEKNLMESDDEYNVRIGAWGLSLIAARILNAEQAQCYATLRDHGADVIDLSTVDTRSIAATMLGVTHEFFGNKEEAQAILTRWLVEHPDAETARWGADAELVRYLLVCSSLLFYDLIGAKNDGAGGFMTQLKEAYHTNLRRLGDETPSARQWMDMTQFQSPNKNVDPETRRALSARLLDVLSEYGKLTGDDWAGDAMALADLVTEMSGECGDSEATTRHFLGAMVHAVQQNAEDAGGYRLRFDVTVDPGSQATVHIGQSETVVSGKYPWTVHPGRRWAYPAYDESSLVDQSAGETTC